MLNKLPTPSLETILGSEEFVQSTRLQGDGPEGKLPLTEEMLLNEPSGVLFGMTQMAGMGWNPDDLNRPQILILSTQGGLRDSDGSPVALG